MRHYECKSGTSNKFWSVETNGREVIVRYGKIGGTISKKVHDLGTPAKAAQKQDALVREKLRGGYKLVSTGASVAATPPKKKLKPRPKTLVKVGKLPAAVAKAIERARADVEDAVAKDALAIALVNKLLAAAAKAPYGDGFGVRDGAEMAALDALIETGQTDEASRVWRHVVDVWTKHSPAAGKTAWGTLAQRQGAVRALVPQAMRNRVLEAWAIGRIATNFEYRTGTLAKVPPTAGAEAWEQACIAITQHAFDAARALTTATRGFRFDYAASILEIMLLREEGASAGALAAFHELIENALKRPKKTNWAEMAALYVLVGAKDKKIAKQIVESWERDKHKTTEPAFFRALILIRVGLLM